MGYWTAIKAFFLGAKFWICLGAALLIAVISFHQGKESCQEKAYEALEAELERQQERSNRALKQAVKDARTLKESKESGNELVEEAKAVAGDNCQLSPDQLSVLQRIQQRTKDQ